MNRQAGFTVIEVLVAVVVVALILFGWWVFDYSHGGKTYSGQIRQADTSLGQQDFRIVYVKDNVLYSVKQDGTGLITLSAGKVNKAAYINGSMLESQDGRWLFVVQDGNVWRLKTDGSRWEQLTNFPMDLLQLRTSCAEACDGPDMELLAVSQTGDMALFSIYMPVNDSYADMAQYSGTYVYRAEMNKLITLPHDKLTTTAWHWFDHGDIIFVDDKTDQIRQLDLKGNVSPVAGAILKDGTGEPYVDFSAKFLLYETGNIGNNSDPERYSAISLRHFGDANFTYLSPKGGWDEYQCLTVSPGFSHAIYCHEQLLTSGFIHYEMYHVDLPDTTAKPFETYPCRREPDLWINDQMFVCSATFPDQTSNLFTFDFATGKFKSLVTGSSFVVPTK